MNIAQSVPVADTWMHGGWGWGWGWMSLMMVMMVLFWAAIIAAIVWVMRGIVSGRSVSAGPANGETPAEILDRRFAEGEIDEADYRARLEVLAGRGEPVGGT